MRQFSQNVQDHFLLIDKLTEFKSNAESLAQNILVEISFAKRLATSLFDDKQDFSMGWRGRLHIFIYRSFNFILWFSHRQQYNRLLVVATKTDVVQLGQPYRTLGIFWAVQKLAFRCVILRQSISNKKLFKIVAG